MFKVLKLQENHELKLSQVSRQLIDKVTPKVNFFYLEDRDICDYYISMSSESKNDFFKSFSFIYKIALYLIFTSVWLQKVELTREDPISKFIGEPFRLSVKPYDFLLTSKNKTWILVPLWYTHGQNI